MSGEKKVYVGTDDFVKVIRKNYYYVDKTLLIKELTDNPAEVTLFTRPRRFGKTMNVLMLKAFYEEIPGNEDLFQNLKIWQCGETYTSLQGKYPVIYFTLKDIKKNTWEDTYDALKEMIQEEYDRHERLGHFSNLSAFQRKRVDAIMGDCANRSNYENSLKALSNYIHCSTGSRPIILIDEYDAPVTYANEKGFGSEILSFLRNFLSAGLKTNEHFDRAVLTGVLRIAQADLFSGFNNVRVRSVLDEDFSSQFGFTQEEVTDIANYYGVENQMDRLKEWYDGYLFGNREIYNPWSVMNYFSNQCVAGAYWTSTGSNELLNKMLRNASAETVKSLTALLNKEKVKSPVRTNFTYEQLANTCSQETMYSMLLMTGYLKAELTGAATQEEYDTYGMAELSIPNQEIERVYSREIFGMLTGNSNSRLREAVSDALLTDNPEILQKVLREFVLNAVSFYDTAAEGFYHALVLGLIAASDGRYYIKSNREAGNGRYDLMLVNPTAKKGILIEFKIEKGDLGSAEESYKKLEEIARTQALAQITDKNYDIELKLSGAASITKYGIAFNRKYVSVVKADI